MAKQRDNRPTRLRIRSERQEALREQLRAQGHVQYAVDLIHKLEDESQKIDAQMVYRYKVALDARFKLIAKYAPDLKSVEVAGEIEHNFVMRAPEPLKTADEWASQHRLQ